MGKGFGLLSALTLLGMAQGVFLALALVNSKGGDVRAHRLLALLTAVFALDLGQEFLYQTGFFNSVPGLLQVLAPLDLLYGPLIYLYVLRLTNPQASEAERRLYWHFVPALVGIVMLLPFYLLDGPDKLAVTEALRKGAAVGDGVPRRALVQAGLSLFVLGTLLQVGLYLALSVRKLVQHSKRIRDVYSDIERISLTWLRNLLLGLGAIFLLYLGDQFFPDLMGMNILGDLITVVAVVLIYLMGYLGLRQPAIFSQAAVLPPGPPIAPADQATAPVADDAEPVEEKYRRSGLDKETGRLFLDELTRHMQAHKPYLDGDLMLPHLAQQLGISANYLSQVINEQLNVNFYDFVNGYRVEEAKRLMAGAGEKAPNVLAIALESGFNSKSAFYTAFRKATSMTPTQYRKTLDSPAV